jgi:hypothetical protein
VLRVLPVAFVISAYAGFVLTNLAQLWTAPACAPWQAYAGTVAVRVGLIAVFMPLSVALVSSDISRGRAWVVGLAVAAAMLAIQGGTLGAFLAAQADKTCARAKTCVVPGAVSHYVDQGWMSVEGCL